jgi:hypothetical protein
MKFDPLNALELAESFAFDRQPTSPGELKAVGLVADSFERAGLRVSREEVVAYPIANDLRVGGSWIGFAFILCMGTIRHMRFGMSRAARFAVVASAFAWLVLTPKVWERVGRFRSHGSWNVVGERPGSMEAPVRVVFVTALDAPRSVIPDRLARFFQRALLFLVPALLALMLWSERPASLVLRLVELGIALLILLATVRGLVRDRIDWRPAEGPADNRDGLATLIELARTWPGKMDERMEARFVAAGAQSVGAGLKALVGRIRDVWPPKPTLVIGIWSPGLGPPFYLTANGLEGYETLEPAAESLWIPYRWASGPSVSDLWPFGAGAPDFLALMGRPDASTDPVIRPESLGLAAQLATEIALRWTKQATARDPAESQPGS